MSFGKLLHIQRGSRKKLPLLFECLLCTNKFTTEDVSKKRYYVDTGICKKCYIDGSKLDPKIWCFAKKQTNKSPGYSPENLSCKLLCPDKAICVRFIKKLKLKEK